MASRGAGAVTRGKQWERHICKYAAKFGFRLERIRAGHHDDVGDLAGFPGFMVEAKAAPTTKIGEGVDKMLVSHSNSFKKFCVMFQKRPNKPINDGWAIMRIEDFLRFAQELESKDVLSSIESHA